MRASAAAMSGKEKVFWGPLNSAVAGRTDHLPIHVPQNSHVLTADVVSSLGEGNTLHGFKVCLRTFGDYSKAKWDGEAVPVVVAGGEYIIFPEAVLRIGGGDMEKGHAIIDDFIVKARKSHIKTLRGLPGPRKD